MYCIGGGSFLGDLELGDLLLARIARGVRSCRGNGILRVGMVLVGLGRVVVEALDDLVGVDLEIVSLIRDEMTLAVICEPGGTAYQLEGALTCLARDMLGVQG